MTKEVESVILDNQKKYNEAFHNWMQNGCVKGDKDWQTMFSCISFACLNKAKAMLRGKVFIQDVEEKALDCTIHIMEVDELKNKKFIESLGAYVGYPLMNYIWQKKVIRADKTESLEELIEKKEISTIDDPDKSFIQVAEYGCFQLEEINKNQTLVNTMFAKLWGLE